MANREGKCPKCGGDLSIPEELLQFSCMYCGAVLRQEELVCSGLEKKKEKTRTLEKKLEQIWEKDREEAEELIDQILELDKFNVLANQIYGKMHFSEIVLEYLNAMESFTRSEYTAYFDKYRIKCRPIVETVDRYALMASDHGEQFMHQLASELVKNLNDHVNTDKKLRSRNARSLKLDQYKMILAVYTIPMIQELKLGISDRLSDIIIEEWMRSNPKSVLRKGSYKDMVAGFRKGKLCFITTAVCESFGKPDDCYELTCFRGFRDAYMMSTEEGRKLVDEYYEKAPGIVTCIDMEEKRGSIYASIWENYLEPCLHDIETGREDLCEKRYTEMVRDLTDRYLS